MSAGERGLPTRVTRLAHLLGRLPGVGDKTAQRFALYLVLGDEALPRELGAELATLHEAVGPCSTCGNLAERTPAATTCAVCADPRRDASLLCVVERVQDLLAIERSGVMRGRYFVLGKLLSPLEGVAAEDLPLAALRARMAACGVREVLVATPPSVDGEATALWLARELASTGAAVTRIASGVPHGGDLEFADQVTLGRAIEGRKNVR